MEKNARNKRVVELKFKSNTLHQGRYTEEEREKLREEILLKKQAEEAYNLTFRKSLFFKFTLIIRISYILLLSINFISGNNFSSSKEEIVENAYLVETSAPSKIGNSNNINYTYHIITNLGSYSTYGKISNSSIKTGDTVIIERNIFNKPIYFGKSDWDYTYGLNINRMYYIILFITIISLVFIANSYKERKKALAIISGLNLIAILLFFLA